MHYLLLLPLFIASYACAQLSDDFTDGNFTANPSWNGTSTDFIVNSANQLQTSNTVAATSYLSAPHGLTSLDGKEWHLWVRQTFSASANNYSRIYLTAASPDLSSNPDGFFIQLGEAGSTDAVRLYRSVGGNATEICSGTSGEIANSFAVGIRIVRSNAGVWTLSLDPSGGMAYVAEATGTDLTDLTGTHSGVLAAYTASNASKFYFDDIYAGDEIIDTQPPSILSATPVSSMQIDVLFDETVSGAAAITPTNYTLMPAVAVQSAAIDGSNGALVHLIPENGLTNGQHYQLTISAINDLSGNTAANLNAGFIYLLSELPAKGDLVVSEFLCDPTPVIGLAEVEFIEIYNRSNKYFDLTGWKLGDASADGTITSGWIMPGEYKLLCAASSQTDYPGALSVTSFPSLNNSNDDIVLKSPDLTVIDRLSYTEGWYHDAAKAEGGWSLELINPEDPCSDGSNWKASEHPSGGTPDAQNSVYDATPDIQPPLITGTNALAPNLLELTFSEGMDSLSLVNAVLEVDPDLTIASRNLLSAFPGNMTVAFNETLAPSGLYTFTLGPASDCWLNTTGFSGRFVLPEAPVPGDVVINELLFDPGTGGSDFVELYNRSQKVLDLKGYSLANFDDDTIANFRTIGEHYLLFPGEYLVLTPDSSFQLAEFPAAVPGKFYEMALPPLGNDSATVYLLYDSLIVLDRVAYKGDWHLSLIDDTQNKTLERLDPAGSSSYSGNWHTAAEPIGFGTPGGRNSQYEPGGVNGEFGTLQTIFSPDNDGFEDVLQFFYTMPQPDMIAMLRIFDDQGRLVRESVKSELLGIKGNLSWDGVNDDGLKATPGVYLAVIEAFSIDGNANYSKRVAFTLAGKLD